MTNRRLRIGAAALQTIVSVSSPTQAEGNSGSTNLPFVVSLTVAQPYDVKFTYATRDGTATAGSDYTSTSGVGTITAGQTSTTINVPIAGDTTVEGDEALYLDVTNVGYA